MAGAAVPLRRSTPARSARLTLVAFDGACLRGKCDEDPVLGYELMSRFVPVIVERLQATRLRLLDVYGHVAARLTLSGRRTPMLPTLVPGRRQAPGDSTTPGRSSSSRSTATASPSSSPGQFTMLYAFGAGEVPISVSGDRRAGGRSVHTVRAVGAATTRDLRDASRATQLGVRGPFGSAWPLEEAEGGDVVVVAGGIGLAPLRPGDLRT